MSGAQISSLFVVWSVVGIVAEVPTGALADRFSRRLALVAAGMFQAAGYGLWIAVPGYAAFAAGFVLWGLGGAFGSGALEALLYDGMASVGAESHYPRVYGRVAAVSLLSQIPAAVAATALFSTGGYDLVGWASVACCLSAAAVATQLPEARAPAGAGHGSGEPVEDTGSDETANEPGSIAVVVWGLIDAVRSPAVGTAVVAVAVVGSLDGIEEYFSLFAHQWGIATSLVPLTVLAIPLVGAAGAAFGGSSTRLRPRILAIVLCSAVVVMVGATVLRRPEGVAGMALAYGLYRFVLVRTEAGLQQRIQGRARATVTSLAALGTDLAGVALYAAWASNRPVLVVVVALAAAAALPRLFASRPLADQHDSASHQVARHQVAPHQVAPERPQAPDATPYSPW